MTLVVAYLDGGTLSVLVGVIATGIAGLGVYARRVWYRIVKRIPGDPRTENPPTE
jgi:hypothetical protein